MLCESSCFVDDLMASGLLGVQCKLFARWSLNNLPVLGGLSVQTNDSRVTCVSLFF
jgi:hypothetical protein